MGKSRVTIELAPWVLAAVEQDARDESLSLDEYVERALVDAHFRARLARAEPVEFTPEEERLIRRALDWQNRDL
ncbi:hypothetical protein [Jiangella rhizosphaerae]|nr:hypothetical protein [Jiangella rhizosphaerae]